MHGARGGPKTKAGFIKCKMASFKHGMYSQESLEELKALSKMLKKSNLSV